MAGFTPGPWLVGDPFSEYGLRGGAYSRGILSGESNGVQVATVVMDLGDGEDEANAALIAAAPDLYTSCDLLTQALEQLMPKDETHRVLLEIVLLGAKTAMAKATGEVPA